MAEWINGFFVIIDMNRYGEEGTRTVSEKKGNESVNCVVLSNHCYVIHVQWPYEYKNNSTINPTIYPIIEWNLLNGKKILAFSCDPLSQRLNAIEQIDLIQLNLKISQINFSATLNTGIVRLYRFNLLQDITWALIHIKWPLILE